MNVSMFRWVIAARNDALDHTLVWSGITETGEVGGEGGIIASVVREVIAARKVALMFFGKMKVRSSKKGGTGTNLLHTTFCCRDSK